MTSAAGVAAAIVVMFGPYSLVGPFFGPLLDRWRRRQILLFGNAVRCLLALCVAAATWGSAGIGIVYALTLSALGLSRFLLSCLSAGLPSVVGERELLTANSVVPTLGGLAMGIGAVAGFLIRVLLPEGSSRDVASLFVAAVLYLAASGLASLLRPDQLGPKREGLGSQPASPSFRSTVRDLVGAAVYLTRRRTPALALATMSFHRFVYEMEFITIILVSRNLLAEPSDADAGLAYFGTRRSPLGGGSSPASSGDPRVRRPSSSPRGRARWRSGRSSSASGCRAPRSPSTRSCSPTPPTPIADEPSPCTTSCSIWACARRRGSASLRFPTSDGRARFKRRCSRSSGSWLSSFSGPGRGSAGIPGTQPLPRTKQTLLRMKQAPRQRTQSSKRGRRSPRRAKSVTRACFRALTAMACGP